MQSLPSAAPASFPSGSSQPTIFPGSLAGLNADHAPSPTSQCDAEPAGFADLLAGAPPDEFSASPDVAADVAPDESKKTPRPNLLLACFFPGLTPLDLPANENPLSLDLGDSPTPSGDPVEKSEFLSQPSPFTSAATFRCFARSSTASDFGEPASALNEFAAPNLTSPTPGTDGPQPPPPSNASPFPSVATPPDLASKLESIGSAPGVTADAHIAAVSIEKSATTIPPSATESALESLPSSATDSTSFEPAVKIAPPSPRSGRASLAGSRHREIKFLTPEVSGVTKSFKEVGTDVAKSPADTMPTLFKTNLRPADSFATTPAAFASAAGPLVDFSAAEAPAAPTAKSAVQHVVAVMEAEAQETASANLKMDFDFGDTRLTVRVEMRDGTLQAHFHTDSAALQSSLSREWRVAAASEPEKFVRFAEPSFNSSTSQNSFSGQSQGEPRRESSQAREARDESNSFGRLFRRSRSTALPLAPVSTPASPALLSLSQLNTFA